MTESAPRQLSDIAHLEQEGSRLRGTLVARLALKAELQSPSAYVDALRQMEHVQVETSASSSVWGLESGAQLITAMTIAGVRHLSMSEIPAFTKEKADASSGKYGPGTYFGAGNLRGETVELLAARAQHAYDASLHGSFLLLDRSQVLQSARQLRAGLGMPHPSIKSNIQNAPLTQYLEGYVVDGHPIAGAVIFADKDRTSAEIVVAPSATNLIQANPVAT